MAKGNLLLGMTRGKVGDIVFTRGDGEQVIRARNRQPRNPRTPLQMVSRVILKTSSSAYSRLQAICNHSFEGRESATANQARFMQLNNAMLQERVADILVDGISESILSSILANFAGKNQQVPVYNDYIVSEGQLQPLSYGWEVNTEDQISNPYIITSTIQGSYDTATYAQMAAALGLKVGDQVSLLALYYDTSAAVNKSIITKTMLCRFILDPASGDANSVLFLTEDGEINQPNPRNQGSITFGTKTMRKLIINTNAIGESTLQPTTWLAVAIIASRQAPSGLWLRSTQSLLRNPLLTDTDVWYLGDAVASYMDAGLSSKYLNQAE